MNHLAALGEFGLIRALTEGLPGSSRLICGPGDDCAVLQIGNARVLLSCDALVENVHFRRDWMAPEAIGWKAAAAALSDIAAMGGTARCMLISLGCPETTETAWLARLYAGINQVTEQYNVPIAGGDTVRSPQAVILDITVVGDMEATLAPRYRSDAQPGDIVAVTGHPGSAALGMAALERGDTAQTALIKAHTHPHPRLAQGAWLAKQDAVHAMIDLSDGLVQDLGHIATRSGVGIHIETENLPLSQPMRDFAPKTGRPIEHFALSGGEDYELALTMAPEAAADVCARFAAQFNLPLTRLGSVQAGEPLVRVNGVPAGHHGFDHFAGGK